MNRQEIIELKHKTFEKMYAKEHPKLKEEAEKNMHGAFWSRYYFLNYPDEFELNLARKDHICNVCKKKKIKKGTCYFRRSFGQMWTIKACSIRCFLRGLP